MVAPSLLILLLSSDLGDISSDNDVLIRDDELVVLIVLILNIIDVLNSTTMMHIRSRLIMRYMSSMRKIHSRSLPPFRDLIALYIPLTVGPLLQDEPIAHSCISLIMDIVDIEWLYHLLLILLLNEVFLALDLSVHFQSVFIHLLVILLLQMLRSLSERGPAPLVSMFCWLVVLLL